MKLVLKYTIVVIFCLNNLHGQSIPSIYSKNVYAKFTLGLKHHQPIVSKSPYFKIGFIPDLVAEIGILTFSSKKHGWQFMFSGNTKNFAVKLKDTIPGSYTKEKEWGFSKWYYQLTINKSYNFNLSKNINSIVCAGPALYLNNNDNDSLIQQNFERTFIQNTKSFGIGVDLSVMLNKKISDRSIISLTFGYQRGFVNFLNLNIVNHYYNNNRTFANYYGSGPSVKIGIMF